MQVMSILEQWLRDFPQQFQEKPNITILLSAFARQLQEVKQVFQKLNEMTDLAYAVGTNLDYVGTIIPLTRKEAGELVGVGVMEPVLSDEHYRQILKYKLLQNTSDGTYNDMMAGLEYFYDFPFRYQEDPNRPATVILNMPLDLEKPDLPFNRNFCIKPSGVKILGEKKFFLFFLIFIYYENTLLIQSQFYPRSNKALLFLDGAAGLDGTDPINGYTGENIDFYPVQLLIHGDILQKINYFERIEYFLKAMISLKEFAEIKIKGDFYPRCNLPLFRLDGTQFLDGTHTLNEMDQDFESLFLNGSGCLNGEYITNGYMDCHNFDFYPLQIEIKGEYKQKSVVSGFLHPIIYAKLLQKGNSLLNIIGSVKKKVRTEEICSIEDSIGKIDVSLNERLVVEKDLYFLDGEQRLDGTVCLDADIYEVVL